MLSFTFVQFNGPDLLNPFTLVPVVWGGRPKILLVEIEAWNLTQNFYKFIVRLCIKISRIGPPYHIAVIWTIGVKSGVCMKNFFVVWDILTKLTEFAFGMVQYILNKFGWNRTAISYSRHTNNQSKIELLLKKNNFFNDKPQKCNNKLTTTSTK